MTTRQHSRAARLQIIDKLALARHAATLLHSKEEALERERTRLSGHETRSRERWNRLCAQASTELLRARALGASDELAGLITRGPLPASVSADWQDSMGITYPGSVTCVAESQPGLSSTAALRPAARTYGDALTAAAEHAATMTAVARIDNELASTRRRRRAIGDHLVPSIETDLHALELSLDEDDREESLRVRLAFERQGGGRA